MNRKQGWALLKQTASEWIDDRAPTLAAALAYYTIFSLAPLLIIAVAVAGFFFGAEAVRGDVQRELQELVGQSGAKVIEDMMVSASKPGDGIFATVFGVAVLLFGASGVFTELQETMNVVWKVKSPPAGGVLNFIRLRFLSFAMVLGIGFLLLVSLLLTAALAAIGSYFDHLIPGWIGVWHLVNLGVSFGVVTLLFALIYKILPDTKVAWRDVWLGAAVTALLFNLGKFAIGLYLGKTSVASSYGAAGSVAILLIWVYYSAQILFLGAEFTQVYAEHRRPRSFRRRASPHLRAGEVVDDRTTGLSS
jgi:membrane protein